MAQAATHWLTPVAHLPSSCPPAKQALLEREADLRQEELDEAAAAAPVSRLVLAVHGVGQKLAAANIAEVLRDGLGRRCWVWQRGRMPGA